MKTNKLLTTNEKLYSRLIKLVNIAFVIMLNINLRNENKYINLFYLLIVFQLIFVYLWERESSKLSNENNKLLIYKASIFNLLALTLMAGINAYIEGFKIAILVMIISYGLLLTLSYSIESKKYAFNMGRNLKVKYCFLLIAINIASILIFLLLPTNLNSGALALKLFWPLSLLLILYYVQVQIINNEQKNKSI